MHDDFIQQHPQGHLAAFRITVEQVPKRIKVAWTQDDRNTLAGEEIRQIEGLGMQHGLKETFNLPRLVLRPLLRFGVHG
jgi:hypothetical protein